MEPHPSRPRRHRRLRRALLWTLMPLTVAIASSRCYVMRPTRGGAMAEAEFLVEPRRPSSAEVTLPGDGVVESGGEKR